MIKARKYQLIDTKLREKVQPYFDISARLFLSWRLKPDTITLLAFVIGIVSGVLVALNMRVLALATLWLSGFLDVIDGTLARMTNTSTLKGAYMDLILDRMVECAFILGLAFLMPEGYIGYILFLISVIFNFSTFIVAGALFKNTELKSMHYDVGLIERTETFIVFSVILFFGKYSFYILTTFSLLIMLTGIIRFKRIVAYLSDNK